jgi:hypothetical protein
MIGTVVHAGLRALECVSAGVREGSEARGVKHGGFPQS